VTQMYNYKSQSNYKHFVASKTKYLPTCFSAENDNVAVCFVFLHKYTPTHNNSVSHT